MSKKYSFEIKKMANVIIKNIIETGYEVNNSPFWNFIFVEKENIKITSKQYSGNVSANQMFLFKPHAPYKIEGVEGKKSSVLIITFESNNKELDLFTTMPTSVPISLQNHLFRTTKEHSFLFSYNNDNKRISSAPFGAEQLLYQNFEYFFIMEIRKKLINIDYTEISRYPSIHKKELANIIIDYIDKHINENISNKQLCIEFCVNKTTLCKIFLEATGITLTKYINQAKIQVAKSLIREGEMNFTQIAEYLSFSSIHYFCKVFQKYENQTPTEYSKTVNSYVENK